MDKDKVKQLLMAWYKWKYTYIWGEEPENEEISSNEKFIDIFIADIEENATIKNI